MSPAGFYLVLWEDGEIARVSPDQVRYMSPRLTTYRECFPGQGGVPAQTYTYQEAIDHTLPLNHDGSNPNVKFSDSTKSSQYVPSQKKQ